MALGAARLAAAALITVGLVGCIHAVPNKNVEPMFKDQGGEFTGNPYNHLEAPEYSKGRIAGFRELFVEADPFAEKLAPATPAEGGDGAQPANGTIPLDNITTSYAEVSINGDRVGVVPPLARARVHDVAPGTYEVDFLLPNGFKWTEKIATTEPEPTPAGNR